MGRAWWHHDGTAGSGTCGDTLAQGLGPVPECARCQGGALPVPRVPARWQGTGTGRSGTGLRVSKHRTHPQVPGAPFPPGIRERADPACRADPTMEAAERPRAQVGHRCGTGTGDPPLPHPWLYQRPGLCLGGFRAWGRTLLGQRCPLDWWCPYLDKVLVDPFGEGFLLDTISLICKRREGQVSQWHQGHGMTKTRPLGWHRRARHKPDPAGGTAGHGWHRKR